MAGHWAGNVWSIPTLAGKQVEEEGMLQMSWPPPESHNLRSPLALQGCMHVLTPDACPQA